MLRRFMPTSLYARIALIVILPIFLIQSLITYVVFVRHWELVSSNLSANVAGQVAVISTLYAENTSPDARSSVETKALEDLDITIRFEPDTGIPEKDKTSLLSAYNQSLDRELDARLAMPYWINTVSWPAYIEVRVQLTDGHLVFYIRRDRIYATNGPIFVLWLIGTSLLIGWIAIIFMRNQVRSILRLANAAEAFGRGRDAPDFRPTGAQEVRRAGRAFIAMRERIKRHLKQRATMLAGVSHDLKTPLTRMKLALAMQPDTEETSGLRADVEEMEQMLEGYLDFARDLSTDDLQADVDVSELIDEIIEADARSGETPLLDVPPGITITARRDALKRALTNLLSNGYKYAKTVWLTARHEDDNVIFTVDDDGDGIDPADYENAFRPFVRLDEARNPNISGIGLGLSVVRDVARSHGGEIILSRSPRGGLRASLRVPA